LPKSFSVDGLEVVVVKGDITKVKAEAIVNPANSLMIMGGGVAGAIKRAGGEEIEREAMSKAPVRVGEAVATCAGRLSAKFVIHAPTMERPAMRTTLDKVRAATRAALLEADKLGVKEIAFPGMGTGVGGLDPREAAKAMVEEILKLWRGKKGRRVMLVAYDDRLYKSFVDSLREVLGEAG